MYRCGMKRGERSHFLYVFGYVVGLITLALVWLLASFAAALWVSFAVVCVLFAVPVQIIGTAAVTLLAMVAVTHFYAPFSIYSEQLAVYVFYFLCLLVVLQLRGLITKSRMDEQLDCEGITFSPRCVLAGMPPQHIYEEHNTAEPTSIHRKAKREMLYQLADDDDL